LLEIFSWQAREWRNPKPESRSPKEVRTPKSEETAGQSRLAALSLMQTATIQRVSFLEPQPSLQSGQVLPLDSQSSYLPFAIGHWPSPIGYSV
jgi:hypothetical protein